MEIIVEGKGSSYVKPNMVIININFVYKEKNYEDALKMGTRNVQLFIDEVLSSNGFNKEDMKTRSYVIREETKYNSVTGNYDFNGYSFTQSAVLKIDYNIELMANFMNMISKLNNPPFCNVKFGVKDENTERKKILSIAYKDAESQAMAIAEAAGKNLKYCAKVDFKSFTTNYISNSGFESDKMYAKSSAVSIQETIVNTFTPEDIEISEKLYCLWIAE